MPYQSVHSSYADSPMVAQSVRSASTGISFEDMDSYDIGDDSPMPYQSVHSSYADSPMVAQSVHSASTGISFEDMDSHFRDADSPVRSASTHDVLISSEDMDSCDSRFDSPMLYQPVHSSFDNSPMGHFASPHDDISLADSSAIELNLLQPLVESPTSVFDDHPFATPPSPMVTPILDDYLLPDLPFIDPPECEFFSSRSLHKGQHTVFSVGESKVKIGRKMGGELTAEAKYYIWLPNGDDSLFGKEYTIQVIPVDDKVQKQEFQGQFPHSQANAPWGVFLLVPFHLSNDPQYFIELVDSDGAPHGKGATKANIFVTISSRIWRKTVTIKPKVTPNKPSDRRPRPRKRVHSEISSINTTNATNQSAATTEIDPFFYQLFDQNN